MVAVVSETQQPLH
jgi:hypothetical protein